MAFENEGAGDHDDASPRKKCFVICPIGEVGSPSRQWSDDIYRGLIQPVADKFSVDAYRIIDDSKPGEITEAIIANIYTADIVLADLTFNNPNVFYELAVRHALGKPYVHIAKRGEKIPFDISPTNVVAVDIETFVGQQTTMKELEAHFKAAVDESASFENPLTRYHFKVHAKQSGNPVEQSYWT